MSRRAFGFLTALLLMTALVPPAGAASGRVASYVIVLHDSVRDPGAVAREHGRSHSARIGFVYTHALRGYSATMSDTAAARIGRDPRVDYVEADGVVTKVDTQLSPPSWGLDRVDDRLGLDKSYEYTATGSGVRAYVIDSGISSHTDFTGRLAVGWDFIDNDANASDCDGHGTHVAGTIGGTAYGVAKAVTLVPVRVLNCSGSGTWSGVIAGIDWVAGDAATSGTRAVANMSLGGGYSSSVNDAVERSSQAGVVHAVAAGNGNSGGKAQDACNYSPASAPSALTVGATNSSDSKASWSNYGTCLDLFAPGVSITSTTMDGKTATWSGTSMATPHVAGVAALYLQNNSGASVATVSGAITGTATTGIVANEGPGSPDLLLYSLLSGAGTTTPADPSNVAPSVSVTSPTDGSTVSGASVTVAASASDTDGSVTKVDFYIDGGELPFATDSSDLDGWTASWDSTKVVDGSHTITAVATDDDDATATSLGIGVTVSNGVTSAPPSGLSLTEARPYKVKGLQKVDLMWVGATSTEVDIYRSGRSVATTSNDGSETDHINAKGGGTYTYKICEAGTGTCSNELTVVF